MFESLFPSSLSINVTFGLGLREACAVLWYHSSLVNDAWRRQMFCVIAGFPMRCVLLPSFLYFPPHFWFSALLALLDESSCKDDFEVAAIIMVFINIKKRKHVIMALRKGPIVWYITFWIKDIDHVIYILIPSLWRWLSIERKLFWDFISFAIHSLCYTKYNQNSISVKNLVYIQLCKDFHVRVRNAIFSCICVSFALIHR